jgi:uncharacterized protein (TIGR03067 family)
MRIRLLLAAVALAGLTAFAPAPFPRPRHDPTRIDLERLQGTWKVVSLVQTKAGGKRVPIRWGVLAVCTTQPPPGVTHIRIRKDVWTYLERQPNGQMHENTSYRIAVDPAKKPCAIDFRYLTGPAAIALGIIRRQGEEVEVLWYPTTRRPSSFDDPPLNHWIITLRRGQ